MPPFDLEELTQRTLKSQYEYIFSPRQYAAFEGGWGNGKSHALCMKALVLSYAFPGNLGVIGRYNATDLVDTTMVSFFEVCPHSWIKAYNKQRKWVTLKNGSQIVFRHLSDPNPKRSHIAGMNLGWFGIDQAEECGMEHWNTLCGRLRRPQATKRFGFLAANPNGKDWIQKLFFAEPPVRRLNPFAEVYERGDLLGIAGRSDENRKSNGGFVDDSYFDGLRQNMPPEWVARYLDCSFEDFSGKVYKEYTLDSIHNIDAFDIPKHWSYVVGIDTGGDPAPWGIALGRIDEVGNIVWTDEFYKATVNIGEVVQWVRAHVPKPDDALFIIDWENKVAMIEMAENDIHCRPAQKKVRPGIIRVGGYVHVNPTLPLPTWYSETQPQYRIQKFTNKGAPRMFMFRNLQNMRREFDEYQWDDKNLVSEDDNLMLKSYVGQVKPLKRNDHLCDAVRYAIFARPHAAELKAETDEKRAALRRVDPVEAKFWDNYDKKVAARQERTTGTKQHLGRELFQETDKPDRVHSDSENEIYDPNFEGQWDWMEGI